MCNKTHGNWAYFSSLMLLREILEYIHFFRIPCTVSFPISVSIKYSFYSILADSVLSHFSSLYRCTCDSHQQQTSPPSSKSNGSVTSSPDGDSSGSDDDKITRRPRTSITMCQRDHLEREFQKERYPTLAYIDKLSHRVHLPQYVIKVSEANIFFFIHSVCCRENVYLDTTIWKIKML